MVKKEWWTLMCHHKSWLKNVNHRDQGVGHQLLASQKVSSEKSCHVWRCAETHLHVCQVNVGEEEAPSNRLWSTKCACWHQGHGSSSRLLRRGQLQDKKREKSMVSQSVHLVGGRIPRAKFADGIQILPQGTIQVRKCFSYLSLDDETIELSITPKPCELFLCGGSARVSSLIMTKAVNFKTLRLKQTMQRMLFLSTIDTDKAPYYAARILDNVTIAPSHNGYQNLLSWR